MDDKIKKLIVSNINENQKPQWVAYVHLNHIVENNKTHFYLIFTSDKWKQGYFLPLNHVKKNGAVSSLNMFPLYHEKIGFNLEEIWKSESISLYQFLHNGIESENTNIQEKLKLDVSHFMTQYLGVPSEQMIRILKWIYNSHYAHYVGRVILLTKFDLIKTEKV